MDSDPKARRREPAGDRTLTVQGVEVPKIGLGTWQITGRDAADAVADALRLGYRHIDTARAYGNEDEVGRGLRTAGIDRGEVFLTTKIWIEEFARDALVQATEDSLRRLGTDYIDLLLLHWPNPDVPLAESLGAMAGLRERGLVRHLGVSNFTAALVEEALGHAPILCNQVEYHPYLGQPVLLRQARERDLLLAAYSPFAHGRLHDDPVLAEIGERHGRTAGQVALRWLLDQPNVCALPKAGSSERRAQNIEVFDFELSEDERAAVADLQHGGRTIDPGWAPEWDDPSSGGWTPSKRAAGGR
jgi:2,5-diketo-D-gluconate reductase B